MTFPSSPGLLAAIDFESAGAERGRTDEPVQIGIATLDANGSVEVERLLRSYLACDQQIVWSARKVHGITDEDIADAPSLVSLWPEISSRLRGIPVVAHGAGTEKRFLRAFPLHGFGPWIDTLTLAREALPQLPDHSLATVTGALGLEGELRDNLPDLDWHDALFDALAALLVARELKVF
ncbi:MAG: exonuclease domain-containing protein [Verrucomicrobiota bacterium]